MPTDQRGSSVVEFALVLPVLLLLVLTVVEFSMVIYDKVVITHAAREAVRAGSALKSPKLTPTEIAAVARMFCGSRLMSMGPAQLPAVTVVQSADPVYQSPLSVTVSFTYRGLLADSFLYALGAPIVLTSTSMGLNE